MHFPQVLVYEDDGRLAGLLRETVQALRWALREPRRPDACLRLLRRGGPGVLVLKLRCEPITSQELYESLQLLERVRREYPETRIIAVGDRPDRSLAGLAWELGAACVLFPPLGWDQLPAVVTGLMEAAIGKPGEVVAEG